MKLCINLSMHILILICVQFEKLLEPQVWLDAACQIFFSLSLGWGGIIAMASFSPRKNNCKRDAILMTICNCSTGLLVASIIFSILGNKAYETAHSCMNEYDAITFPLLSTVRILRSLEGLFSCVLRVWTGVHHHTDCFCVRVDTCIRCYRTWSPPTIPPGCTSCKEWLATAAVTAFSGRGLLISSPWRIMLASARTPHRSRTFCNQHWRSSPWTRARWVSRCTPTRQN